MATTPSPPDLERRADAGEKGIEEKCFDIRACAKDKFEKAVTGYGVLAACMFFPPAILLCAGYGLKCGVQRIYRSIRESYA